MKEVFLIYTVLSSIMLYNIFKYTDQRLITEGLVDRKTFQSLEFDEVEAKHKIGLMIENIISAFEDICVKWKETLSNPLIPKGCNLSMTCLLHEDLQNLTSSIFMEHQDEALDHLLKVYQHHFH